LEGRFGADAVPERYAGKTMAIRRRELIAGTAGLTLCGVAAMSADARENSLPSASDILLSAPLDRWDEGLPLGNGLAGAMIWGADHEVRFSLDRSDLWDLRMPTGETSADYTDSNLQKLKSSSDSRGLDAIFVKPFADVPTPTKIPAGRLVVRLREGQTAKAFHLDLGGAEAHVDVGGERRLTAFITAQSAPGVLFVRIAGPLPDITIMRPKLFADIGGYPDPGSGSEGRAVWLTQKGPEGSSVDYAIVLDSRRTGEETQIAVAIVAAGDAGAGADLVAAGRARVTAALNAGYDATLRPHAAWWRQFWAGARVSLPDGRLQAQCDRTRYFYGAAGRSGAPAIPLQGVWTDESGTPPARRGEYRNDLSVPLTYLPYATQSLEPVGAAMLEDYTQLSPAFKEWASRFFGAESGITIPAEMARGGSPIPGWPAFALSPSAGAWIALLFFRHVRYGFGGASFLSGQAYPFAAAVANGLLAVYKLDANGHLKLPLSSSPEAGGEALTSFLPPNTNWDLSLFRALLGSLGEFAAAASRPAEATRWRDALAKLEPLHRDAATGALTIAAGVPYTQSARHFGHAVAVYPLGAVTVEGSPEDRKTVLATLSDLKKAGPEFWMGYTYAWYGAMNARAGETDRASIALDDFVRGFLSRNGFHVGGDQSKSGLSRFTSRNFSLEGNFMALEAVHEMLLQSWGGILRIFPSTTKNWPDVSFRDLRAEGGIRVSASRAGGRTVLVRLTAAEAGPVRLRNPFGAATPRWSRTGVRRAGADFVMTLARGETMEGRA
jgi:alpha-L-fucosidase 2